MLKEKNEYHIISNRDNGWIVKKSDSSQKIFHFKTKRDAIRKAQTIGANKKAVIVIHKKDGSVQERKNFEAKGQISKPKLADKSKRTFGSAKGKIHMAKDFDATYEY